MIGVILRKNKGQEFLILDPVSFPLKIHDDNPTYLQLYDIIYRIIGQNVLYITLCNMESDTHLEKFDGQLMDGLQFCAKTYALFDCLIKEETGREEVRMRSSKLAKVLVGELLPISRYIQTCYRPGRYISVQWVDGSQSYDAELHQRGQLVDLGYYPSQAFLEATCAMHENEHLIRYLLSKGGGAFAPEGVTKVRGQDPKSEPVVFSNQEHVESFAPIVTKLIQKKAKIQYSPNTSLVVQCYLNSLYTAEDWKLLIDKVESQLAELPFSEVVLFDSTVERTSQLGYRRTYVA